MRAMKNSGVDWIEKIPQKWRTSKLKYSGNFSKGLNITKAALVEEGIPVISYGQVHAKTNTGTGINESLIRYVPQDYHDTNKTSSVHLGDFIFADTSEDYEGIGNCVYVDQESEIFAGYHSIIFRPTCIEYPKYMAYQFLTNCWRQQVRQKASGVKVFSVTQSILKSAEFLRPSAKEQQSIADYLDKKCAAINSITTDIQHQIEILQKYKQSVITEAVTKGLDRNVEMKDSGIEWLGKSPKEWAIKPIKYLYKVCSGATPKSSVEEYWDGDITWITPADYKTEDKYVSTGSRNISDCGYESCNSTIVPEGSIIFSKRAPIGTVALSKGLLCTNQGCLSCVNNENQNSTYYYYLMSVLSEQFSLYGSGTTFIEISAHNFEVFKLPNPTLSEQQAIADYLDTKCAKIDALIADKQKQLDTLAEYKKSLIYEYVTGKKEVPVDE